MTRRRMPALMLAIMLLLACLAFVLAGCGQTEEKDPPGYYSGKDFQGKGKPKAGSEDAGGKSGKAGGG